MQVKMKLFPLRIFFLNSQSPVAEVQNSTTTSKEPFEKKITKALKSDTPFVPKFNFCELEALLFPI